MCDCRLGVVVRTQVTKRTQGQETTRSGSDATIPQNTGGPMSSRIGVFAMALMVAAVVAAKAGQQEQPEKQRGQKAPPPATRPVGGNVVEGFRLSARPEQDEFRVGDRVILTVTLTNTTDRTLEFFVTSVHRDVYLTVDQDRNRVPLTRLGLAYENRERWDKTRNVRTELRPGASGEFRIAANLFYDMTLSGRYQILAEFRVPVQGQPIPDEWRKVRSNVVEVTLVSP